MPTMILNIIASAMKIISALVSDAIIAKWVASARLWLRKIASTSLKQQIDYEYQVLLLDWDPLRRDRQSIKPKEDDKTP